jgi:hypothetical protein
MSGSHHGHGGEGASPESVASGFELSDWKMKPVFILMIATFASLVLAYVGMAALVSFSGGSLVDTSNELRTLDPAQLPPGPLLEQNPEAEGTQMLAAANEQLASYGWVDRRANVAHIPLDRAKALLLELGVSPFEAPQPAEAAPTEGATP